MAVESNKCSEGLGFNHFYMQSPYNPLIQDYTEIFYMTDKEDIPSIQCKMGLRGLKSMKKVDGLSLNFIDFYVPAFTPCPNSRGTSLQLSENISLFAVCCIYTGVISRPRQTPGVCSVWSQIFSDKENS
jgi:hypothetical protein